MSAPASTAMPTLQEPSSVTTALTTFITCERCMCIFLTYDRVVEHVRSSPTHARALAQSLANGGTINAFITRVMTVMEQVPDEEAYPFLPVQEEDDINKLADDEKPAPRPIIVRRLKQANRSGSYYFFLPSTIEMQREMVNGME